MSTNVPTSLAILLADVGRIKTFVETGTYAGETAIWAAGHFERVVTIEADKDWFARAKSVLAKLSNVDVLQGDSGQILHAKRFQLAGPVMFWLDAHHPTGDERECPIAAELSSCREEDVVLIDDAQYFSAPPPEPWSPSRWPDLLSLLSLLPNGHCSCIIGSVIVSVPPSLWPVVFDFCRKRNVHERLK